MKHNIPHHDRAMTLAQIAAELGVTVERTRQIERDAIAKLRTRLEARGIKPEWILPANFDEAKA